MTVSLDQPALRIIASTMALACALGGCSGTADGGLGDLPSEPARNPYGTGARVGDIIGPASWHDLTNQDSERCKGVPLDQRIGFTGLTVTAVDRFDETNKGARGNVYAQDVPLPGFGPAPYSGMTIYDPGYSPPDLRVIEGDVVDAFGRLTEFPGPSTGSFPYCRTLPEIVGSVSFRFDQGGVAPVVIPVTDLASYDAARQWFGMLVTVQNVRPAREPRISSGRFTVDLDVGGGVLQSDVPSISNELSDLENAGILFDPTVTLRSVTGIVTYFYTVHIAPRSAADIVL